MIAMNAKIISGLSERRSIAATLGHRKELSSPTIVPGCSKKSPDAQGLWGEA
jgi:hypothetical protein